MNHTHPDKGTPAANFESNKWRASEYLKKIFSDLRQISLKRPSKEDAGVKFPDRSKIKAKKQQLLAKMDRILKSLCT